ncbi:MAG: phosphoribosylglycinamide formyltransferase [Phycisphaerales bacterium]|nr:MAG: phosphoribosylglycinamide formyltransferase [Phycisphaerales bacterium]
MTDIEPTPAIAPVRLGILLSGGGRSLQYIHEGTQTGSIPATIVVVIASRPDAFGLTRARKFGCETLVIEYRAMPQREFDRKVTAALTRAGVDLVCMAGFLSFWRIPPEFENRVMNIHPALLPDFGGKGFHGRHVHEAVLAADRRTSGCTVHFADNEYDHGPIILQRTVPVLPDDTPDVLAARVFEEERKAYPEAIRLFAAGRLRVEVDGVRIAPAR